MSAPLRRIWLCADDYGMAPGVSAAIRDLGANGRLNATSVMVVAPSFDGDAARALAAAAPSIAVGLHVTLTGPLKPLTQDFRPLRDGAFLPLPQMLLRALARRLDPGSLAREVTAQIEAFVVAFGRTPDFVDGHQHVHLFPQVRDAVLDAVAAHAPGAWLRQCGRAAPLARRLEDRKGLLLDMLSRRFRRDASARGLATNPAFAGTYDFGAAAQPPFATRFPRFLDGLPEGGVVMCHPGFVDATLRALDPLTDAREAEHAYFAGPAFPQAMAGAGVTLRR